MGDKERIAKAKAACRFDKVYEAIPQRGFVEVIGRKGGDALTFRVYDDGTVTER
jgi:hypothetical protein